MFSFHGCLFSLLLLFRTCFLLNKNYASFKIQTKDRTKNFEILLNSAEIN